jgi:hypothetical protein
MYNLIQAINWSSIKNLAVSPLAYQWALDHPREDTAALRLGRAVHCAILEPEEFASRYILKPAGLDGRTKEGKAWKADAEASGLEVLDVDEGRVVKACAEAVRSHPVASFVFDGVETERVVEWTDAVSGRDCKGRLDALNRLWLADLKTTRDLARFPRDFASHLYHGQLAWYVDGARAAGLLEPEADVYCVAVQSVEPCDVVVYDISDAVLDAGRALYRRLLARLDECEAAGSWPGRNPAIETMELPRWADGAETLFVETW